MTTPNLTPRADNEGSIGTTLKRWLSGFFGSVNISGNITDGTNTVTVAEIKTAVDNAGGGGAVDSVNGQTGVVVLDAADVGAAANDHNHNASYDALGAAGTVQGNLDTHEADTANPHAVTAAQVSAIATSQKGAANGVAELAADGKIPTSQIPALAMSEVFVVASEAAQLELTAQQGDIAKRTDTDPITVYVHNGGSAGDMTDWTQISDGAGAVDSVNGQTGVINLSASDVGADATGSAATVQGNLDSHEADTTNPHSVTAAQTGAIPTTQKGAASGVAELDSGGKVPTAQLPVMSNVPTGGSIEYHGTTAPDGWLMCDGSAVSRTTYADLFAVIGTIWGAGDGSTTFNLPPCPGRVAVGAGAGDGLTTRNLGDTGGEEAHVMTESEMFPHGHGVGYVASAVAVGAGDVCLRDYPSSYTAVTSTVGGGQAFNIMQSYYVANKIIKT